MPIDLNNLVPSMVDLGYDLAAQIVSTGTYVHTTAAGYNPETGALTPTDQSDSVELIRSPFRAHEIDGDRVKAGDERFVIRTSEFVNVLAHSLDDTITISPDVWEVRDFKQDPTNSVILFHVRRVNL